MAVDPAPARGSTSDDGALAGLRVLWPGAKERAAFIGMANAKGQRPPPT